MADMNAQARMRQMRERVWESDIIDWRGWRVNAMQDWKARLKRVDALYQGAWDEVFADESVMRENPHVMNLVQTEMDDIAKLVTEALPSVKCYPEKDTETAEGEANVREAIADTYWEVNDGESLAPRLAMDLAGAGACFVVAYLDEGADYPCIHRVDPRYAYPDVVNGVLQDLLVVETINLRQAARLWPQLGLQDDPSSSNKTVELIHYYGKGECVQAILSSPVQGTQPVEYHQIKAWYPHDKDGNPILPVAFRQLASFDGAFRGMFDQVTGSLQTKNRIVKQLLDYTDEVVYAERVSKGLLNPDEPPGPMAHYRLDPTVADAMVGRVQPAASAPQIFNILEYLDREQRGAVGYPASRQGEVAQSIASGSFVASTQGQLTSTVRNIQNLIASTRSQLNTILFKFDEAYLDKEKSLIRPIGRKKTYTPSTDIKGYYRNQVLYGAAAGLDRLNADVRLIQLIGAGIIAPEEAREQVDFISDPRAAGEKINQDQTEKALLQKLLGEAPIDMIIQILAFQASGDTLVQAAQKVLEAQQAAQAAAAQAQAPEAAPGEAPAEGAMGAPAPAQPVQGPMPPMENIMVKPPTGRFTKL